MAAEPNPQFPPVAATIVVFTFRRLPAKHAVRIDRIPSNSRVPAVLIASAEARAVPSKRSGVNSRVLVNQVVRETGEGGGVVSCILFLIGEEGSMVGGVCPPLAVGEVGGRFWRRNGGGRTVV